VHIRHLLRHRGRLAATATAAVLPVSLAWAGMATAGTAPQPSQLPAIKHVWVIELENEGLSQSFGDRAADPYLAVVLRREGALLKNYYATGHDSADNYISQISGQAPDHATQNDCGVWTRFKRSNVIEKPFGQLVGNGCVYPASIPTLGNQLSDAHWTWKAYLQDMGNQPARDHTTMTKQGPACGHPMTGKPDTTEGASAADQYATRHEGFMYFQSVTGNQAY
jgi:phosphatidylinositol-3-phosphatase